MNAIVESQVLDESIINSIVLKGDLSGLKENQLTQYYAYRCKQVGLDPSSKPFDLLSLQGKKVLYANAGATQQLSNLYGLSTQITNRERVEGVYIVSVRCVGKDGRSSENQGAVDIAGLSGERLANALMKATTKAIRRTILAHIGLGMLDETELDTIPSNQYQKVDLPTVTPLPPIEEVIEAKEGALKLLLPNGAVHDSFDDEEEWQAGFFGMIGRIASNKKLDTEAKNQKLRDFFLANQSFVNYLVEHSKDVFVRRVQESNCEEFLPKVDTLVVDV